MASRGLRRAHRAYCVWVGQLKFGELVGIGDF
nr:MAG TPA: hypothetical protein [Caudoviricetes sp.]